MWWGNAGGRSGGFELDAGEFLVPDEVLPEFGVVVDVEGAQQVLALLAVGEGGVLVGFLLALLLLGGAIEFVLLFCLLASFAAAAAFAHGGEVALHGLDHLPDFEFVGAGEFMHFQFFLLDEVQPVELAGGEEVGDLLAVLAPVYVEDQLLAREDVVLVERTARLLIVRVLLEHAGIVIIIQIDSAF